MDIMNASTARKMAFENIKSRISENILEHINELIISTTNRGLFMISVDIDSFDEKMTRINIMHIIEYFRYLGYDVYQLSNLLVIKWQI